MSLAWIAIISGLFLVILVLVVYLTPTDKLARRKKKEPPKEIKNWEEIALRWQKQNQQIEIKIEVAKKSEKDLLEKIEEHKKENQSLLEKLAQEKGWREKEHSSAEKVKEKDVELKNQLAEAEESLEKEHTLRLQHERELQELRVTHSKVSDEKRQLSTQVMGLEATLEKTSKELRDLKRENTELSRQKENIQWVAKSDFDELKKILAQKEKELERLSEKPEPPSTPENKPSQNI